MNIAIIGFRGTGKSTISKLLAKKLKYNFVCVDNFISKDIQRFVKKYGWKKFRDKEEEVLKKVIKNDNQVIDCGGGVVQRNSNINTLNSNSKVVLLTANSATILKRIETSDRPPLTNKSLKEEIKLLLAKRKIKYKNAAHLRINTSNITIEEAVNKVIKWKNEQ